jgi:hypothetical protein
MTDISDEVDSNSSKVTVTKDHVKRLKVDCKINPNAVRLNFTIYHICYLNQPFSHFPCFELSQQLVKLLFLIKKLR